MKKVLLILVCCTLLIACTKNEDEGYSYSFSANSSLNIESIDDSYMKYGNVISGSNLVFEYYYQFDDEENIADDEYAEYIRFEIDPSLEAFNFVDEELNTIGATYTKSCFCAFFDEAKDVAPTGSISGKKLSNTKWEITIAVIFYGDESKNISNTFRLKA